MAQRCAAAPPAQRTQHALPSPLPAAVVERTYTVALRPQAPPLQRSTPHLQAYVSKWPLATQPSPVVGSLRQVRPARARRARRSRCAAAGLGGQGPRARDRPGMRAHAALCAPTAHRHVKRHVAHAAAAAAPVHRAASRMLYTAWHVATVAPCAGDRASVQRLERLSLADYDVLDPSDGSFDAEFAALQEQVPACLPRRMCVEPGGARSRPRR